MNAMTEGLQELWDLNTDSWIVLTMNHMPETSHLITVLI
jgi:hypothetical protein